MDDVGIPWRSLCSTLALAAAMLAVAGGSIRGQDRGRLTVDYVGVEGIYLALGSDQGVATGDTLRVFADSLGREQLGGLILTSVTRRRSVAVALDEAEGLQSGSVIWVVVPANASAADASMEGAEPSADRAPLTREGGPTRTSSALDPPEQDGRPTGPRVSGRFSLDLDARETHTSWTNDLSGETVRRFATPTARLFLTAAGLPGGFTVRANVRAAYRYSDAPFGPPPVSIRAYEAVAIKSFVAVPLEVRLGRFYNPYEAYSSYWDGMLLRLGGRRGPGIGIVAGFEPDRSDEGFSSERPRLTAFGDFSAATGLIRYDTDVSVHLLRPFERGGRFYAGWSQRLTIGRLSLAQRLRVDRSPTEGSWSVSQLRVRAALRLMGPLHVNGGFARTRVGMLGYDLFVAGPLREEMTLGAMLRGRRASLSIDGGRVLWDGVEGRSLAALGTVRAGALVLLLSGRYWTREDATSAGIAPSTRLVVGRVTTRVGYRLDRTVALAGREPVDVHTAELQLATPVAGVFDVTVRAQRQFGAQLSGMRIYLGVWRAF